MLRAGDRTLLEAGITQQNELIVLMAGRMSGLGLSSSMRLHGVGADGARQQ